MSTSPPVQVHFQSCPWRQPATLVRPPGTEHIPAHQSPVEPRAQPVLHLRPLICYNFQWFVTFPEKSCIKVHLHGKTGCRERQQKTALHFHLSSLGLVLLKAREGKCHCLLCSQSWLCRRARPCLYCCLELLAVSGYFS